MRIRSLTCIALFLCLFSILPQTAYPQADTSSAALADSIRGEFLHAWNGYKTHAWGHDVLRPLTHDARDWYSSSLRMTPVDAYDALLLLRFPAEAAEAKRLILDSLSFDRDMEVQAFEITIRLLGGLLS